MNPRAALLKATKKSSIAAVARAVGVSRPTLSLLLSDTDRRPGLTLALAIERETGIPATAWVRPSSRRSA